MQKQLKSENEIIVPTSKSRAMHVNAPLNAYLDFHKWVEARVSINDLELGENRERNLSIDNHCSLD